MEKIINGYRLYDVNDFPYDKYRMHLWLKGRKGARLCHRVYSFDIETTRLPEIEQSVMYIWQFAVDDQIICVGRTWDEYRLFIDRLTEGLTDNQYLVVFVHNLSYEFQFLRSIFRFEDDSVFIVRSRKILRAVTGHIEYRCSYLHSNMSLAEFTNKFGVSYEKVKGFDYNKLRFPWTDLTDFEYSYIVGDVIGLNQALIKEMQIDGDNVASIPYTSTGYVRRELKHAMRKYSPVSLKTMQPDVRIFQMLLEAFRGGNTHGNRYYVGEIVRDVHSIDRSSSYPDVEINDLFPMGKWFYEEKGTFDTKQLLRIIRDQKRAFVARVAFRNVRLTDPSWGCPYLTKDKSRSVFCFTKDGQEDEDREKYMYDNGRILYCDYMETTITDVDLKIILDEYTIDDITILECAHCRYGRLPKEWISVVNDLYKQKTELKGLPDKEIYYTKAKNKLNATYGDTVQNPARVRDIWKNGDYAADLRPLEERLEESQKNTYKSFAWGVWTTAWARLRLEEMIVKAHHAIDPDTGLEFNGFVYTDTDSVKYCGEINGVADYNKIRMENSLEHGGAATDPNGVTHYMGVYEDEGTYKLFKTLGAKKYVYLDQNNQLHATIAGVNKKLAPDELRCIKNFKVGFTFQSAGGTESVYNDTDYGWYHIDGHDIYISTNVVIRPSSYQIGIASEFDRILKNPEIYLEIFDRFEYNNW